MFFRVVIRPSLPLEAADPEAVRECFGPPSPPLWTKLNDLLSLGRASLLEAVSVHGCSPVPAALIDLCCGTGIWPWLLGRAGCARGEVLRASMPHAAPLPFCPAAQPAPALGAPAWQRADSPGHVLLPAGFGDGGSDGLRLRQPCRSRPQGWRETGGASAARWPRRRADFQTVRSATAAVASRRVAFQPLSIWRPIWWSTARVELPETVPAYFSKPAGARPDRTRAGTAGLAPRFAFCSPTAPWPVG